MLNGTKEDVETLERRMEARRLRAKLGKVPESQARFLAFPSLGASQVCRSCPAAASAPEPVANPPAVLLALVRGLP